MPLTATHNVTVSFNTVTIVYMQTANTIEPEFMVMLAIFVIKALNSSTLNRPKCLVAFLLLDYSRSLTQPKLFLSQFIAHPSLVYQPWSPWKPVKYVTIGWLYKHAEKFAYTTT